MPQKSDCPSLHLNDFNESTDVRAVFPLAQVRSMILNLSNCCLVGMLALSGNSSMADVSDWPGYLGPNRDSISPDTTPLADSWPEGDPPVLWTVEINPGHGGAETGAYSDSRCVR